MIRRVSSRPRLVSDADRAFQNATVEQDDGYSSFEDGCLNFDDDDDDDDDNDNDGDDGGVYNAGDFRHLGHKGRGKRETYLRQDIITSTAGGDGEDDDDDDGDAKTRSSAPFSFSGKGISSSSTADTSGGSSSSSSGSSDDSDDIIPSSSSPARALASSANTTANDNLDVDHNLASSYSKSNDDSSVDDLSQFLSCYDLMDLHRNQVVLEEGVANNSTTTAAVATLSTKRKRLASSPSSSSQHYLTPKSSYSSLANIANFANNNPSSSLAQTTPCSGAAPMDLPHHLHHHQPYSSSSMFDRLPADENLLCIASYLSLPEIRTLSSTCRSVRTALFASRGAIVDIWMGEMRRAFPGVFQRTIVGRPTYAACEEEEDYATAPSPRMTVASALDDALGRMRSGSFHDNNHGAATTKEETRHHHRKYVKSEVSYPNVTFVDDYQLPIPGLTPSKNKNGDGNSDNYNSNNKEINLPLLASLLPSTHPQTVDPDTLRPFRSYAMCIDVANGTSPALSQDADMDDTVRHETTSTTTATTTIVPVVQFTGRVNRGNRCIRSDMPFPPSCRKVSCDCTGSNNNGDVVAENGAFANNYSTSSALGGLSSWMKNHTPRRRVRKNRNGNNNNNNNNNNHRSNNSRTTMGTAAFGESNHPASNAAAIDPYAVNPYSSLAAAAARGYLVLPAPFDAPVIFSSQYRGGGGFFPPMASREAEESPMDRFLASLSRPSRTGGGGGGGDGGPTFPSVGGDDGTSHSPYFDRRNSYDDDDDAEEQDLPDDDGSSGAVNGVIKHGLFKTCKECIGKLQRHHNGHRRSRVESTSEGLRPFVVPIVVNDTGGDDEEGDGGLVVDVTPRLVAYFEVTIVKQGDSSSSTSGDVANGDADDGNAAYVQPDNRLRTAGAAIDERRRRNHVRDPQQNRQRRQHHHLDRAFRMPRPVLPAMNLPLPLLARIHDARQMEALERIQQNSNRRQQQQRQQQQRQQQQQPNRQRAHHGTQRHRHECVAVGLSTRAFRPHDKMPGWDDESYGYHGDDGGIFHGRGDMLRRYGPSFGPGDTVGCGLDYGRRRVFFVKNGVFLGWAFGEEEGLGRAMDEMVEMEEGGGGDEGGVGGLYPTVGVDTECPVFVNYGEFPFAFDLREFASRAGEGGEEDYAS